MADLPRTPLTRQEEYLSRLAGENTTLPIEPLTREEMYLEGAINRVEAVEEEVKEIKDNPDVVDIVATYSDLQSYDTSTLTDKDVIRVLADETHSGNSTYYRWDATDQEFDFIGEIAGGGGDSVYSTKTTSNSANGGAVYIGSKNTSQEVQQDPTITDNHYKYFWALPASTTARPGSGSIVMLGDPTTNNAHDVIMIGYATRAVSESTALGGSAFAQGIGSTALGYDANAGYSSGSIAIGWGSHATKQGEMNIGTSNTSYGFNNTKYRLISGVYDGQDNHDAATVAQGNKLMTAAPTSSDAGVLGQLWTDTTGVHTYQCTAIDTTDPQNPSYTWTEVGSGGGGEFSREITTDDLNYPVNNPTDVALWLLDPGVYHVRKNATFIVRTDASDSSVGVDVDVIVLPRLTTGGNSEITPLVYKNTGVDEWQFDYVYVSNGSSGLKSKFLMGKGISNNLTVSTSGYVLDARQGKALNEKITPTTGSGAPTTSTTGIVGKIYIDTATNTAYMCVSDTGGTYTWKQITN